MIAHLVVALALAGPPDESPDAGPMFAAVPWTAAELREEVRQVFSQVRRKERYDPEGDVPALVLLHAAVQTPNVLDRGEQVRYRQGVEYRLNEFLDRLRHERIRTSAQHQKSARTKTGSTPLAAAVREARTSGGAAEARNVQLLIDLIEAVIQPESWETNGGRGSIRYFAPLQVLVIRNTQQVHREIGGLRGTLGAGP